MILDKIVARKKMEVAKRKEEEPLPDLLRIIEGCPAPRPFGASLVSGNGINIIAEIKRASPSAGMIAGDVDPKTVAAEYAAGGAAAVSVLTDRDFFAGDISYINMVKRDISLPVLRKDFIIDSYQVYEARAYGADAVLLIAAILAKDEISDFLNLAESFGMEALVEVHERHELLTVLDTGARIVGINNRNLKTFEVSLQTTIDLIGLVPGDRIVVSESGIKERSDIVRLENAGARAVLIGETLMRAPDRIKAIRDLRGEC
ncbi:MAG: indole-3-glycerol phosphate synthase TrpC [Pseudomonadota bacterium]